MEKQKVLIVDDEARNQRIMVEILEELVEYKVASSGEEALKILETFVPDVILLDIMMPGLDGYGVCRAVRADARMALTKVILVSGKAMIEERLKGYEIGADEYMTKPFVAEELLAKVKVFLRVTAVERELSEVNASLDQKVKERTEQLLATEAKLLQAAKMSALGEMAGGIAHEINTPLGVISLVSDQLEELTKDATVNPESVMQLTDTINRTVKRISTIISGLRNFSRDGSKDHVEAASLKQILEETLNLCSEKMRNSSVKVELTLPDSAQILCRSVQISQVFLNLLNNACDAIGKLPDRWIKISAEPQGDGVAISITDSGPGIPKEVQEKLFQPFFTTKEIGKGTGLGLSISKGIIESHRGKISIDADCPNTRFLIWLPAPSASQGEKAI